ncbi:hypothetical protein ACIPPR_36360 [Streptomyces nigra]
MNQRPASRLSTVRPQESARPGRDSRPGEEFAERPFALVSARP